MKWEMTRSGSPEVQQQLLEDGWQPFAVSVHWVWFRRMLSPLEEK